MNGDTYSDFAARARSVTGALEAGQAAAFVSGALFGADEINRQHQQQCWKQRHQSEVTHRRRGCKEIVFMKLMNRVAEHAHAERLLRAD